MVEDKTKGAQGQQGADQKGQQQFCLEMGKDGPYSVRNFFHT